VLVVETVPAVGVVDAVPEASTLLPIFSRGYRGDPPPLVSTSVSGLASLVVAAGLVVRVLPKLPPTTRLGELNGCAVKDDAEPKEFVPKPEVRGAVAVVPKVAPEFEPNPDVVPVAAGDPKPTDAAGGEPKPVAAGAEVALKPVVAGLDVPNPPVAGTSAPKLPVVLVAPKPPVAAG